MTFGSSIQIEKFFEPGFTIYRATFTKDASGGLVKNWEKIKDIVGRLRTNTRSSSTLYDIKNDKLTEDPNFLLYCGMEDIQPGDEIRKDNMRYTVLYTNDVMTFGRFLQVELNLCEESEKNG